MASMCAQVTPLTSCPVLENKTGGRRSGVRRTGKKEREGAVRADPGAEGTVALDCRALVRGQKAPEGWPRGAGCPLPQERLGPRGGPGQELVQGQGLRRDENRGQCGRGAHPPAERGPPRSLRPCGEGTATAPLHRFTDGPAEARGCYPPRTPGRRRDRAGTCPAGGVIADSGSHRVIPWAPAVGCRAKRVQRGPGVTCCAL